MEKDEKVKKTTVVILTKSPWPEGRIGKKENQDWYEQCRIAATLKKENDVDIFVSSSTKVGFQTEEQYYINTLLYDFGLRITNFGKGCETISQLRSVKEVMGESHFSLIVTWTHSLRAKYLLKTMGLNAKIIVAWGIPRPQEIVTDFILILANPIMDWLNLTDKFLDFVSARRASGSL